MRTDSGDPKSFISMGANHAVEHQAEAESRFRESLSLLLRGKWIIVGSIASGIAIMAWITSEMKPVYQAESTVLIGNKYGKTANPFSEAMEVGASSKLANEIGILRTRSLALVVAKKILEFPFQDSTKQSILPIAQVQRDGVPTGSLTGLEAVANRALGSMEFLTEDQSDIISLRARSDDAGQAALLANLYAEAYQDQTMIQSRSRSRSVREFLESRLAEQRDSLHRAEVQVRNFMESSGIVGLDAESDRIVQELSQLEASRNALDLDIQTADKRLSSLKEELPQQEARAGSAIGQVSDAYIRQLSEELGRLEVQRDIIIAQNDPAVLGQAMYQQRLRDIEAQVKALREKLNSRSAEFIKSYLAGESASGQADGFTYLRTLKQQMLEAKFQLETLRARRTALQGTIEQYENRFRAIPKQSIEFARLQRERMGSEHLFTLVEERFNQAAITEKSEFGYVDILDRAVKPDFPVSPNLQRNLLIGIILGLGIGLGIVIIRDAIDVRVRTPEQLRNRGFVSLAEVAPMGRDIARLKRDGAFSRDVRRFDPSVWLMFDPFSLLAESYRRLRTGLLSVRVNHPISVILITSANPAEGKTTTACNLALSLCESQKRVILLDADIRRPMVHAVFGLGYKPGLAEFVEGRASLEMIIQQNVVENLDFIPSGSTDHQASKLLSSDEMKQVLAAMKQQYEFVVVDAPPVLVASDAGIVAELSDVVLLVASAGSTRLASLRKAAETLSIGGTTTLGIVLNNFDAQKTYGRYFGGHRYGHYGTFKGYTPSPGRKGH